MIPYGRQSIDNDDITAVCDVLRSDYLTQGPKIKEFEDALCAYTGAQFAVAVASGTAALHLLNLALKKVGKTEALTSPISFTATSNSMAYVGLRPQFIDIQSANIPNMSTENLANYLNSQSKDSINHICPIHFAGFPRDNRFVVRLARRFRPVNRGARTTAQAR